MGTGVTPVADGVNEAKHLKNTKEEEEEEEDRQENRTVLKVGATSSQKHQCRRKERRDKYTTTAL
jgi:hypothetical protein